MREIVRNGLFVTAAVLLTSTSVAFAATFGVTTQMVGGAANAPIARCDTNGLTVATSLSGSNVTSVTVSDIADPGCEGASVRVTLTDSLGASIASGGPLAVATDADTIPNSLSLPVSPSPAETSVINIHVSLAGP